MTQEFFYVMRPYRVGIMMGDATNGVGGIRFYDSTGEALRVQNLGNEAGNEQWALLGRDPAGGLRTGVTWANATKPADLEGKAGEAFFYELRGYDFRFAPAVAATATAAAVPARGTSELIIHEKLAEIESGALTAANAGTIFFAGGPVGSPANMTFNENIARGRGAWSGSAFHAQVAGTAGGSIGESARNRTYTLFYVEGTTAFQDNASRYVFAMETLRPQDAAFGWSQYAVVLTNAVNWNVPITVNNVTTLTTFVEIRNARTGVQEQIFINSVNGLTATTGAPAIFAGDRIRLVSRGPDGQSWNVISTRGLVGDVRVVPPTGPLTNFAQDTTVNTRDSAVGREYTFTTIGTVTANQLSTQGLNVISSNALAATNPTTTNADQRAIITNDTKIVIYSTATVPGVAAVSEGTAAQLATFLDSFLRLYGGTHASNLRVVAQRAQWGGTTDLPIQAPGVARYIFIDTTLAAGYISMAPVAESYGLIGAHHDVWFLGAPRTGTVPVTWRRGTLRTYNAAGVLESVNVCWPESESASTMALGSFVAVVPNEFREESPGGTRIPVVRFVDDTVSVSKGNDFAARTPGTLTTDPGVSVRIAEIVGYTPGVEMTLSGQRNSISLLNRANTFNIISREELTPAAGTTAATYQAFRYWGGDPAVRQPLPAGNALWFNGLDGNPEVRARGTAAADQAAFDTRAINERRFAELRTIPGVTLWAVAYMTSSATNPQLLSMTIVIDYKGLPVTIKTAQEILDANAAIAPNLIAINTVRAQLGNTTLTGLAGSTEVVVEEIERLEELIADFKAMPATEREKVRTELGFATDAAYETDLNTRIVALERLIEADVAAYLRTFGVFGSFVVTAPLLLSDKPALEGIKAGLEGKALVIANNLPDRAVEIYNKYAATKMATVIAALDAAIKADDIVRGVAPFGAAYAEWRALDTDAVQYNQTQIAQNNAFKAEWAKLNEVEKAALALRAGGTLVMTTAVPPAVDFDKTIDFIEDMITARDRNVARLSLLTFEYGRCKSCDKRLRITACSSPARPDCSGDLG
jgi:hypothetical protein